MNRIHLNIVVSRAGVLVLPVCDVQDLEIQSRSVSLEHKLDVIGDLPPGSVLPLLPGELTQPGQTGNGEPIFVGPVGDPVVELGVDGNLKADLTLETAVTALEVGHPVLVMSNLLLNLNELRFGWQL